MFAMTVMGLLFNYVVGGNRVVLEVKDERTAARMHLVWGKVSYLR